MWNWSGCSSGKGAARPGLQRPSCLQRGGKRAVVEIVQLATHRDAVGEAGDRHVAVGQAVRHDMGGGLAIDGGVQRQDDLAYRRILGALGERKYTMGTGETVLNMIRRFSTDWRADVLEGFRRIVADILIGNGDNHLKNWSFLFPSPGEIRLSPAYDIVPTVLYIPDDQMALQFVNTSNFNTVTVRRFRRAAKFLGLEEDWIEAEISRQVKHAVEVWQTLVPSLLDEKRAVHFLDRLRTLTLVQEVIG